MVAAPAGRSASVVELSKRYGEEPVTSGQLVNDLVALHPRYAGRRAAEVLPHWPEPARRRSTEAWLTACERLLVDDAGGLNGQLVILLLALLDPPTGRAMTESGLVASLLAGYVVVDDEPEARLAGILDPVAAAPGVRASPLIATMYGLDSPSRLPTISGGAAEVSGLCWPWALGPVLAYGDGSVEQVETGIHATSGITEPVSVGADSVRIVVYQRRGAGEATLPWSGTPSTVESGASGGTALRVVSRSGQTSVWYEPADRAIHLTRLEQADGDNSPVSYALPEGVDEPVAMAVTDDGQQVLTVDDMGRLTWWGPDSEVSPWTWNHPWTTGPVRPGGGLDVDPSGRLAAMGTADGRVLLVHRPATGPLVLLGDLPPPEGSTSPVEAVALSPDAAGLLVQRGPRVDRYDLRLGADRLRSGYLNDLASRGRDYLELENDVEALAMLVTSRQLEPPLSIGLFGDWGTGKSFFITRLRQRVETLSREARDSGLPQHQIDYWKHVRCLEFNAWTFAEANLWASLMESVLATMAARPVASVGRVKGRPLSGTALLDQRREQSVADLSASRRRALRARIVLGVVVVAALALGTLLITGAAAGRLEQWWAWLAALGAAIAGYVTVVVSLSRSTTDVSGIAARLAQPFREWREGERQLRDAVNEAERLNRIAEDPALLVTDYIAGRRGSGDYRKHLGLVGMVREDLERIDTAVTEANEAVAPAVGPPTSKELESEERLNRIVVFIDDLDRCPPPRVVEVLEAVHLLLAYRLFVVVLAVDSRWLQQSLRAHYRDLLAGERAGAATPLDYLEKIVQLPYQLPRMTRGQATTMISELVGADDVLDDRATPRASVRAGPPVGGVGPANGVPATEGGTPQRRLPTVDLEPEGLHVSADEARWLAGLAPLVGSTPRTVKRFVNGYRVIKARSTQPRVFAADLGPDSEYRLAAFLLAVLVGCEEYAVGFVAALRSGRQSTLGQVLDAVRGHGIAKSQHDQIRSWAIANGWLDRSVQPLNRTMDHVGRFSFVDMFG
ncbi:MAG TPA: P-loop NTPase fold protein [Jiangellaceae bacterium]|nr:P-loop NTPase fold protein [Jiangellaceae bacterium]